MLAKSIVVCVLLSATLSAQNLPAKQADLSAAVLKSYYRGFAEALDHNWLKAKDHFSYTLHYMPYHKKANLFYQLIYDMENGRVDNSTIARIFYAFDDDRGLTSEERLNEVRAIAGNHPDYYGSHIFLALAAQLAKKNNDVLEHLNTAIRLEDAYYYLYYMRGQMYLQQKEDTRALQDFYQALQINPNYGPAWYEAGLIYNRQQRFEKAIEYFEKAIPSWPLVKKQLGIYEAYNNHGTRLMQQGRFEEALLNFERAVELDPYWQEGLLNRGIALRESERYDEALQSFSNLIELNDHHDRAYYHRGLTYSALKNYPAAEDDLGMARAIRRSEAKYTYALAEAYFKDKKYRLAADAFDKVLQMDASYYWAWYWQAFSQEKLKNFSAAITAYDKFVKNAPEKDYKHRLYAVERIDRLQKWLNRKK